MIWCSGYHCHLTSRRFWVQSHPVAFPCGVRVGSLQVSCVLRVSLSSDSKLPDVCECESVNPVINWWPGQGAPHVSPMLAGIESWGADSVHGCFGCVIKRLRDVQPKPTVFIPELLLVTLPVVIGSSTMELYFKAFCNRAVQRVLM